MRERARRAVAWRLEALTTRLDAIRADLATARRERADLAAAVARLEATVETLRERLDGPVAGALRAIALEDAGAQRRLAAIRAAGEYGRPFEDAEPLVSICVAVLPDRLDLLVERALPSALQQTHGALEIVVVGDGVDPEGDPRVRALADERVRFGRVTQNVTEPGGGRRWLSGGTVPRNEAARLARGAWLTELDDDDALAPDAVARLLEVAREQRAEVAYGRLREHLADGRELLHGGFPPETIGDWTGGDLPRWRGRATSAALVHAAVARSFPRVHVAHDLGVPGDLLMVERMVRAGVRFAFLDAVVYDYWPGRLR